MSVELLNEDNGEILGLDDYLAQLQDREREIGRLDQAIAANKTESKAMKDAREQAVFDLRALAREVKRMARVRRRATRRAQTSARTRTRRR